MTAARRKESLLEALAQVPEPRGRQERRYPIASILALGINRRRTPEGGTLHQLFVWLEAPVFEAVLGRWLADRGLKRGQGIAVDGKTRRGIHGEHLPVVHLISAFAHQRGIVLAQRAAPGTPNAPSPSSPLRRG